MSRSSNSERAQRINAALVMIHEHDTLASAAAALAKAYAISERQAYRYVREAKTLGKPVPVPDEKIVFTVKLPQGLVYELRERASRQGQSLSALVTQALMVYLRKSRPRG